MSNNKQCIYRDGTPKNLSQGTCPVETGLSIHRIDTIMRYGQLSSGSRGEREPGKAWIHDANGGCGAICVYIVRNIMQASLYFLIINCSELSFFYFLHFRKISFCLDSHGKGEALGFCFRERKRRSGK